MSAVKDADGLQIPSRRVLPPREVSPPASPRTGKLTRIISTIKRQFALPTLDQMRWPIQVGISSALTSLVLMVPKQSLEFFSLATAIGILSTIIIESTSGGSLRKVWLYLLLLVGGSILACILFTLSTSVTSPTWAPPAFISLSSMIIAAVWAITKRSFPVIIPVSNLSLSISENVLLATYSNSGLESAWQGAIKRTLAIVVGAVFAILTSYFVLARAARPSVYESLAKVLHCMADILEPLVTLSIPPETLSTSSAVAFSSYPHLLADARRLLSETAETPKTAVTGRASGITPPGINSDGNSVPIPRQTQTSLLERIEPNKKACEAMMESLKKCQAILASQMDLAVAARKEVSCKKPYLFPKQKFLPLLAEVRILFFHISSLVFAVNLYLSTVEYNARQSEEGNTQETVASLAQRVSKTRSFFPQRSKVSSQVPRQNHSAKDIRTHFFDAPPLLASCVLNHKSSDEETRLEAELQKAALYIVDLLRLMASCAKVQRMVDYAIKEQLQRLDASISMLEMGRKRQREKVADIIFATLEADVTGTWPKLGTAQLDWQGAVGVSASALQQMSQEETALFYDSYWLRRDRVSAATQNLHVLYGSLTRCCSLLDVFIGPSVNIKS